MCSELSWRQMKSKHLFMYCLCIGNVFKMYVAIVCRQIQSKQIVLNSFDDRQMKSQQFVWDWFDDIIVLISFDGNFPHKPLGVNCFELIWRPSNEFKTICLGLIWRPSNEIKTICLGLIWRPSNEFKTICFEIMWRPSNEIKTNCF